MNGAANPVGRWALVGALVVCVLMILYYAAFGGTGYVAFGVAAISIVVAAFLYLFYARINGVQRSGYAALFFVILIALLLPFFFLAIPQVDANATRKQYDSTLYYAAGKFATYCSQCHGLLGQGISGPPLNVARAPSAARNLDNLTINDITRIITAGVPVDINPANVTNYDMPAWGNQYLGPFNADDINAMVALVTSSDPVLRAKNNAPDNTNGFDLIYNQLTPDQQALWRQQLANLSLPAGTPIDLTNMTTVMMPIINTSSNSSGFNFDYTTTTGIVSPVIKVKAGTKIVWVNQSTVAHTVQSGSPISGPTSTFASPGLINPGATFEWTANAPPGNYPYFCTVHPAMQGEIIIVP
jgi:plastocyanin/mono/diheme cytochrome c family protein